LFGKLAAEELEAGWGNDNEEEDIPNFGDSQSLYEEVCGFNMLNSCLEILACILGSVFERRNMVLIGNVCFCGWIFR
jgi:hypothetical protein